MFQGSSSESGGDPVVTDKLEAQNVVDFKLFVNLVDLVWDLLPEVMTQHTPASSAFSTHCCRLVLHLVTMSTK